MEKHVSGKALLNKVNFSESNEMIGRAEKLIGWEIDCELSFAATYNHVAHIGKKLLCRVYLRYGCAVPYRVVPLIIKNSAS